MSLALKYKLALKALGQGPDSKIYKAADVFLPLLPLAKLSAVTLTCKSYDDYIKVLELLEIPETDRYKDSFLQKTVSFVHEDVKVTVELKTNKPSK